MTTDRPTRRRPRLAIAGVAVLALLGTAGCQPAPPPPSFTVDDPALAHDAAPGDGVCEATAGAGDCTLNAAIDEANAQGRGVIDVPPAEGYETLGLLDATITGHITLRSSAVDDPQAYASVGPARIDVAAGAALVSQSIDYPFGDLTIEGSFIANRFALVGSLQVEPGGQALIVNAFLQPGGGPALTNEGTLTVRYSTIDLDSDGAIGLDTAEIATTRVGATAFLTDPYVSGTSSCAGTAPTSDGYNVAADTTCALSGPGDLQGSEGVGFPGPFPDPDSPLRDAIAPGTLGCGTTVRSDIRGGVDVRPNDGNGDGVAACDIGAWEA